MAQPGYAPLWSSTGRDDFNIMKNMGANYIRLYHPIGEEGTQPDHSQLLDAASKSNLKVFGAVHQYLTCDGDNCYKAWNNAVEEGLKTGFAKDGAWHSSVWAINMINEVDAMVQTPKQQVLRIISAVDGLIAAEKSQNVKSTVKLTSCFTTALASPLGGGDNTIYHGFSSMENWIKQPSLVDYTPESVGSATDLAKEIDRRWIHCMNAQIPWKNGLDNMVATKYTEAGMSRPWIVGEMGFNGAHQDVIKSDIAAMQEFGKTGGAYFAGSFVFQFQTAYQKSGAELNFGLFGLGDKQLATVNVAGKTLPVHCLTSRLWAFEQPDSQCKADCNHRAQAVTTAFGGTLTGAGLCLDSAPMGPPKTVTVVAV